VGFVDAAVSGGMAGAGAGSLTAMVTYAPKILEMIHQHLQQIGGTEEDVRRAKPVLEAFCEKVGRYHPMGEAARDLVLLWGRGGRRGRPRSPVFGYEEFFFSNSHRSPKHHLMCRLAHTLFHSLLLRVHITLQY